MAVLAVLALAGAACGGGDSGDPDSDDTTPTTVGTPQPGGSLTVGIEAESNGLNPTSSSFAVSGTLMATAVFDTITKFDDNEEPQPYLAEKLDPNDDFTEWTITLRPGITFHDGTPLTSEAIKATIEAQRSDALVGIAVRPVLADPPVEIIDELTATVKLTRSLPYFPAYVTTQLGMIASPKWLAEAKADPEKNQFPVGTGPYKMKSRQLNARTVVERNEDYWRDGLPYLDEITFVVSTDAQVRAQSLKAGDFDIIHTNRDEDIVTFREDDAIQLWEDDSGEETFVMLNTQAAPFDDVRARQVLAHATDRETMVQLLGSGITQVANGMFAEGTTFYSDVEFPEFDPERAAEIAADYCADEPTMCDGDRIKFDYKTTPSADNNEIYETLSEMWSDVVAVKRVPVEQAAFIQEVALGNYQAVLWRQFGAVDPDSDMLWLDSENIGVISLNFARNVDPEIDEWLDQQRVSLDLEERQELWAKISAKLNVDLPYIWLNHTLWGIVADRDVHGVEGMSFPDGEPTVREISNGRFELMELWKE
ncbi:MAG TPA: ABC transporter substrate-binding protein [Acidimicrobiia bacterium]|nr:ABC transporter substrate-binding protein [Acidimicrobiia bacterium]